VFITASLDKRIHTATERLDIDYDDVEDKLKKYDQKRERFYNSNTNKKWGSIDSYDMCLDSGKLGYEMCRDIIVNTVEMSK
jgi:cytidylate kinase